MDNRKDLVGKKDIKERRRPKSKIGREGGSRYNNDRRKEFRGGRDQTEEEKTGGARGKSSHGFLPSSLWPCRKKSGHVGTV